MVSDGYSHGKYGKYTVCVTKSQSSIVLCTSDFCI